MSIFLPYREPINDRRSRDPASRDFLAIRETRILSEAAIMATNEEKRVGKFHPRCGAKVELSNENRVACGKGVASCFAFSNDQIPIGLQFSVKILQQTSIVSPISASSRPHTSDAPYIAGGACISLLYSTVVKSINRLSRLRCRAWSKYEANIVFKGE